jgi:hypothetical protein
MFRFAVQLCRDGLEKGEGRELVIEMLEFGARLEAARSQAGTSELHKRADSYREPHYEEEL